MLDSGLGSDNALNNTHKKKYRLGGNNRKQTPGRSRVRVQKIDLGNGKFKIITHPNQT